MLVLATADEPQFRRRSDRRVIFDSNLTLVQTYSYAQLTGWGAFSGSQVMVDDGGYVIIGELKPVRRKLFHHGAHHQSKRHSFPHEPFRSFVLFHVGDRRLYESPDRRIFAVLQSHPVPLDGNEYPENGPHSGARAGKLQRRGCIHRGGRYQRRTGHPRPELRARPTSSRYR